MSAPTPSEARMRTTAHPIHLPAKLNADTASLVCRFAEALGAKLRKAEQKYEYDAGWLEDDWEADCKASLLEHVQKGDPRDVAAYCAFMWHHGWRTSMTVEWSIVP